MRFKPLSPEALRLVTGLALIIALARPSTGQQIPDLPERDSKNSAIKADLKLRLDAGKSALGSKDHARAVQHFTNALWWDPFSPAILGDLVEASAPDEDAQTLWAHQYVAGVADERGAFDAEGLLKKIAPRDPLLAKIAAARAEAATQLAGALKELRGKDADQTVVARWIFGVAQDVVGSSPALRKKYAAAFTQPLASALPDYKAVLAGLKEVMDKALGEQRPDLAIRVAQCLLGIAAQSRFKDLEGPKPPQLESVAMAARAALARAREQIEAKRKDPIPTIADLEAMTKEEREKFTRDHSSFDNPGVTMSPKGLYRIETVCGHGTLLGVAKTIELHHARLAKHFGSDPFAGQPGIVRVVPESSGLEGEGTPFWWAGGFQSGPITTVKFSCGTIGGLGHGLTHELTHRFDGALNPGIPAWLAEGRAVWTGAAYGAPEDADFVANHARFGTVEDAFIKGYGDEANLKKLVEGTIEDYRHNYTAGYALYLFLRTGKDKEALPYAERLAKFEHGCKEKGGNSLEWFTSTFCDNKQGRPKDFKAFAEKFGEFVKGFYWQSRAPWTARYTEKTPPRGDDPVVLDGPTWHESRDRAEPWFGQDQARIAGDLLLEAGRKREAAAAFEWSLLVDDWRLEIAEKLSRLLEQENRTVAAWAVRNECSRRFAGPVILAPMPYELARVTSKAASLTELLGQAQKAYAGKPLCAAAMAADHNRLGAHLAVKPLAVPPVATPPEQRLHPLDEAPRALGLYGWEEDKLTGFDERRVKDLWYEVPEGDLHVGRSKPREGTGSMDRAAYQRDAFVRTREWFSAGRYVITARMQVTTSFISGAVIVGYTRRDRNVHVDFSGGDFLYSIGAKEEKTVFDSIGASLRGLWERDGALHGSNPHHGVKFEPPTNAFLLRILVDGPAAHAYVNDELIGVYHTIDGQAIEGYVGFASGHGAYLVAAPTIQRRDRSAAADADPAWPKGFDPSVDSKQRDRDIVNLHTRGIPIGPVGTLALWIPEIVGFDGKPALSTEYMTLVAHVASGLDEALKSDGHATGFVVYLPESLSEEIRKAIESDLKFHVERVSAVLTHKHSSPLSKHMEENGVPEITPTVLYMDPRGVVRVAEKFQAGEHSLRPWLNHWLSVFENIASARRSPTDPKEK